MSNLNLILIKNHLIAFNFQIKKNKKQDNQEELEKYKSFSLT